MINRIIENYQDLKPSILENPQISEIRNTLVDMRLDQWCFLYADFGVSFWHLTKQNHYEDKVIDSKIKLKDINELRGINYGQYETPLLHPCIVIKKLSKTDKQHGKTLLVAPITSAIKKPLQNDILISAKNNPFLQNDSYVRLNNITTIGYERVNLKLIQDILKIMPNKHSLSILDIESRKKVKEEINNMF